MSFLTEANYKKLFFILAAVMLVIMVSSSSQYGICWDEMIQNSYGVNVLKFYSSFGKDNSYYEINGMRMRYYGPFFELLAALITKNYSGDVYEIRHFLIAIFGFIAILFTGFTTKALANWKTAVLSIIFIFLTPFFFGHSMFNSKDIPFAAAYIASIYFIIRFVKEYPAVSRSTIIYAVISIGIAISIRVGGLLLFLYLLLFLAVKLIRLDKESLLPVLKNKRGIIKLVFTFAGAYLFAILFWPYALISPIGHIVETLSVFTKLSWSSNNLFNGIRLHNGESPWYYIPTWIFITTPLFITFCILLFPIIIARWNKFKEVVHTDTFLLVFFTAVFPVIYIIIQKANVFDGWRHTYFIYPSIVV